MSYKVSILTPVYGVEKYIAECAVSLMEQTYDNIEYVFVDDCTPDRSIEILRQVVSRYPQRQHQVRILRHDCNRGLGAARQTALENATGEFVTIVDSDDSVPSDSVKAMVEKQTATNADIVSGSYVTTNFGKESTPCPATAGTREWILRRLLVHNTVTHVLWGRLLRRSLFADYGISWTEGVNMAEDLAIIPCIVFAAKRMATTQTVVYRYRVDRVGTFHQGSMSQAHFQSFSNACQYTCDFFMLHDAAGIYRLPLQIGMTERRYMCELLRGNTLRGKWLRLLYLVRKRLYLISH